MIAFILGIIVLLIIIYSVIENRFIKTVHYYLQNNSIVTSAVFSTEAINKSISIVQLSDLHNCNYGKSNSRLLRKISLCKPDLIVLTGDIINKNQNIPEELFAFWEKLSKICPCIYSLGNHELKCRERQPECFKEYIERIKEYGIIVADNEAILTNVNDVSCCIAAYSSDLLLYKKVKTSEFNQSLTDVTLPECGNSELSILLAHDPDLAEIYVDSDYGIVFCGHLHGGIVRIPGYRGIISTRFTLFPRYDGGYYQLDKNHVMIVSRGLGMHTIKFRLFNRPELVHAIVIK